MKSLLWLLISSFALSAEPTLIEQRIFASRQTIEKNRKDVNAYNELALALIRRARETANPASCVDAEAPVAESLRLAPTGFGGRRTQVAVWLCEMRWKDALAEATSLHNQVMDDVPTWGYIADAQTALGNYAAAATAVQWMVNMRQASPQALQRAAMLREAYGLNEAALDWLTSAMRLTSGTDVEERAWLLTRIARLNRIMGRTSAADDFLKQALTLVPDYPWALTELGLNFTENRKYSEAVETFQKRQQIAPSISGLYQLAVALDRAGKLDEAKVTYLDFEKRATPLIDQAVNENPELIAYYSDAGDKPEKAVRIARAELTNRHDLDTLAGYAHALAAQGNWQAAAAEMQEALKTGVKNPVWLLEAGRIARKAGDESAARKYFRQALEAAPTSPDSDEVIQELAKTRS